MIVPGEQAAREDRGLDLTTQTRPEQRGMVVAHPEVIAAAAVVTAALGVQEVRQVEPEADNLETDSRAWPEVRR